MWAKKKCQFWMSEKGESEREFENKNCPFVKIK